MDLLCFCSVLCLLCLCARLFICAWWSPAGKGLTSWLSFVVSTVSLSLSRGILGQVWYLIASIPDLCTVAYFMSILLYVHSSIAIILMGKSELIALLNLSSWCLVMVERLFLAVPRGCLQFVVWYFLIILTYYFTCIRINQDT